MMVPHVGGQDELQKSDSALPVGDLGKPARLRVGAEAGFELLAPAGEGRQEFQFPADRVGELPADVADPSVRAGGKGRHGGIPSGPAPAGGDLRQNIPIRIDRWTAAP